jgi:hypothetical protein
MSRFLGPLDSIGRVPPHQQTRVAAFLISLHGALARRLAISLPLQLKAGWQTELNAQLYREAEIASLLLRATSWVPDPALPWLALAWETAWLTKPVEGVSDRAEALAIDIAALGHAAHGAIRPAALLPAAAQAQDPFVIALRRIEFESSRLIQAQIVFLKSDELKPLRGVVSAAVETRHAQVRKLWTEMLDGIGIRRGQPGRHEP